MGPEADLTKQEELYRRLFSDPPREVALDIETISLSIDTILGIGIATPENHAWYFDIWEMSLIPWHLIHPSSTRKIWYNAPFDLKRELLGKFHADIENIDDAIIVMRMLPGIGNSLKDASQYVQTQAQNMGDVLKEYEVQTVDKLPFEVVAEKCMQDALATMQVWKRFRPAISDEYYNVEREFLVKLMKMSYAGIKIDADRAVAIDVELEARLAKAIKITDAAGFNPNSPKQVAKYLHDQGLYLPFKYKKGVATNLSTDEDALETISDPIAATILEARRVGKAHTRMHKWARKPRVYTHLYMDGATGRTMSRDENLQNIDSGHDEERSIRPEAGSMRSPLIPDQEFGTLWDLEQIELRAFAYITGDKNFQNIMNDPTRDIHNETMKATGLKSRVYAKGLNFGRILFNGSDAEVARQIHVQPSDVAAMWQRWSAEFSDAANWLAEANASTSMTVQTLYGRTLDIGSNAPYLSKKQLANRRCNYPVQGTAAEVFKRIMISTGIPDEDIRMQIHDEEWADGIHELSSDLAHIAPFWTPLKVEYVRRFDK